MGTKNNPGQYDCYAKAAPDEPLFTLRAKDPSAPYLVRAWAATRRGNFKACIEAIMAMHRDEAVQDLISSDGYDKLDEALSCADSMAEWRKANVVQ